MLPLHSRRTLLKAGPDNDQLEAALPILPRLSPACHFLLALAPEALLHLHLHRHKPPGGVSNIAYGSMAALLT